MRAIDNLSKKGVVHIRSNWLKQAETAEANSFVKTAQSIIKVCNSHFIFCLEHYDYWGG